MLRKKCWFSSGELKIDKSNQNQFFFKKYIIESTPRTMRMRKIPSIFNFEGTFYAKKRFSDGICHLINLDLT